MLQPKRRLARTPRYPAAQERAYLSDLLAVVAALDAAARAEVRANGQALLDAGRSRADAERADGLADDLAAMLLRILLAVSARLLDAERLVRARAQQTADFTRRDWQRAVRDAYGIDLARAEPDLPDRLRAFEIENVALIRSVPEQYTARLRGEFTKAVLEGRSLRDMARAVREATGASRKRSELLARDQIGRLNGQLQRMRQEQIGVRSYVWRTVRDERVRASHRARDGKEYKWSDPGPKPGSEIRCRCSPAAVLPGLTAAETRGLG